MKKFIFYTIKSVQENCDTFSCRFKAGFLSRLWLLVLGTILMTDYTAKAQNILGTAPVVAPKGGFAIDGNAFVNYSGEAGGDFLFQVGVTDASANPGGIFKPVPPLFNGQPYTYPDGPLPTPGQTGADSFYVYPLTTFFRDNITINDPTIFTSTNKINDNISSYSWGMGSSPNKNEIQNAIAHFTHGDPINFPGQNPPVLATDLWLIFAADRQVTDGSSYIDFEILQKKLEMTVTGKDSKGYDKGVFTSYAGTPSGRLPGDLLITVEFTKGGVSANVVVRRWTGTAYGDPITPPTGAVYGTNNTAQTIVPYPIYNQAPFATNPNVWAYEPNQWAEGAVNITRIFADFSTPDACFTISTLFVRTRTSGSSGQSELKDFPGAPFQVNLCSDQVKPVISTTATSGALEGCNPTVTPPTFTGLDNCDGVFTPVVTTTGPTNIGCAYTQTWNANYTDKCNNVADQKSITYTWTSDTTLPVIADKPDYTLAGCNPDWPAVVTTTYTDNCDAGGSINGVAGDVQTSQDGCTQYRDYTFNFTDSCLNVALTQTTRVSKHYDLTAPVIADKPDVVLEGCNPAWPTVVTTTYSDNCDAGGSINGVAGDVQTSQDGCTQYRDYTFNFTDSCLNVALTQTTRVSRHYDETAPVIVDKPDVVLEGCNPAWPTVVTTTYSDNCDAGGSINGVAGDVQTSQDGCTQYRDYTFNFTDSCLNVALTQTTRVSRHFDETAPVIVDKPDVVLEGCNPAWPTVVTTTYSDNCDAGGSINGVAGDVQTSQDGCTQYRDYTFNFTDSCLNVALTQTTRVSRHYDETAPVLICAADKTVACGTTVVFEPPTATDNCTGNITINDLGDGIPVTNADGSITYSHSWSATDECTNISIPCIQMVTVGDCGNGCTPGFWKTHPELWDNCNDPVVKAIPGDTCGAAGGEFTTSTGFVAYFGITTNCGQGCNISNLPTTMGAAMGAGGGGCKKLARTGVAALLNASALGSKYLDFLGLDFNQLYMAIKEGFNTCNYEPLATQLDNANNQNHDLCSGLPGTIQTDAISLIEATAKTTSNAVFDAYPVPFKDQFTIRYKFDYVSDVKIEVFNAQGISVLTKTDTNSYLNKEITLDLKTSKGQEQVYIVKVTTNRGSSTKKVVSSR
ncbi:Por secretion system C-terminal sorting domain-containing protein [Flavobacterium fluvii]|uniref:Por secretion system C-terminal sorting domain-containing protein n=1 Tax=Flavobacterium fluvii TaxID=468056 RepID=A0A1M5P7H8_9FLAO|nr:T9SS type A sorting domain-containing protein [Flavobacterium fluvii]SHG97750.1 Por secretion system C-terminal sorting domain-containing protein [Flavobacterium fluvii]